MQTLAMSIGPRPPAAQKLRPISPEALGAAGIKALTRCFRAAGSGMEVLGQDS